jgi:hypothetical protein
MAARVALELLFWDYQTAMVPANVLLTERTPLSRCRGGFLIEIGGYAMRQLLLVLLGLTSMAAGLSERAQGAVTQENFHVRTAADLVALCSAEGSDEMTTAAVVFCHGYAVGVYQTLLAEQSGWRTKLFCVPNPRPAGRKRSTLSLPGQRPVLQCFQRVHPMRSSATSRSGFLAPPNSRSAPGD